MSDTTRPKRREVAHQPIGVERIGVIEVMTLRVGGVPIVPIVPDVSGTRLPYKVGNDGALSARGSAGHGHHKGPVSPHRMTRRYVQRR